MPPVFKNIEVSRDDIGDHMKAYAEEKGIMNQKRRCLIGSMYGEKIMVISPLLKWYVEHGLKVTQIHQVVEYTPAACFQKFGENISDARIVSFYVSTATFLLLHCDEWDRGVALPRHKFVTGATLLQLHCRCIVRLTSINLQNKNS